MSRNLLHIKHLDEFKAFLDQEEIPFRDGKGAYEILQVRHGTGWACVYCRHEMPEHFTVDKRIDYLVGDFYLAMKSSAQPQPQENPVLVVESAYLGDKFIGYRLSTKDGNNISVFANDPILPGFRLGDHFTPAFGKTITYKTLELETP